MCHPEPLQGAFPSVQTQKAGQPAYDRGRDLPRLLALWPHEVHVATVVDRLRLLSRLRRALREERRRGLAGHWTYDLARHAQLVAAYRAEIAACLPRTAQRSR